MSGLDRSHVVILAVALTVILAGCAGLVGGGNDAEAPDDGDANDADDDPADTDDGDASGSSSVDGVSPSTLQSNTLEAMNDIETASFEIEQTTEVGMEYTITMNGSVDTANEKMQMSMNLGPTLGQMESYIIGDTMYFEESDTWYQMDTGDVEIWNHEDSFNQSKELLETGDLEVADTTTVDGQEVYVVEIDMDADEYNEFLQEHGDEYGIDENLDVDVQSVNVTQYIDTESHHVRQMNVDLSAESGMGEFSTTMTITWDDINEPVDIELPADAEDAIEIDGWEGVEDGSQARVSAVAG